jgi:hypothetical protein
MLCQLSSKPADQKHVTSVRHVHYHCLTHICIISPVLQNMLIISEAQGKSKMLEMTNLLTTHAIVNETIMQMYFISIFYYVTPLTTGGIFRL